MSRAIVLGGGMVGSVMAADLAADGEFVVTLADRNADALRAAAGRSSVPVQTLQVDLTDPAEVRRVIEPFDIVLGALSSTIGFQTLRAVIEAGKNYCDISFMPEDAWELDALAKQHGVTAVVDCGIAPGMSNMIAGYAAAQLDQCHAIAIYVGGLPRERRWPFQYKAAFSPFDVIEEYTRPSRIVEHGEIVVKEALSEPELIDFAGIGTLEAFNTDGLRSLVHFLKVPCMKEKTLRYPGHIELMRVFRATGLFNQSDIKVPGMVASPESSNTGMHQTVHVRPIDVIQALMFPMWKYEPDEEDLTIMRIVAEGVKDGQPQQWQWDLLDSYDRQIGATSMSRTTAMPCTIVARMIASGTFNKPGVIPPELIGSEPGLLDHVLGELERRNIKFTFHCSDQ